MKAADCGSKRYYYLQARACIVGNNTSGNRAEQLCSEAPVFVGILDMNDNAPTFERNPYVVHVPIDLGVGTEILRVRATDKDSSNNGDLSYALKTQTGS